MDALTSMFGRAGFLPHGYCFTWTPGLLWSLVGSDGAIALAYFSIPAAILSFVRKRDVADASVNGVAILFSAFIFSCGLTHVMDVWTIWQPDYGLQAATKLVTAGISLVTAVLLWRLIPQALEVPSVQRLQAVIASLEAEVARRRDAEQLVIEVEQSLAATLESIGAGFVATDRGGFVKRMNAVAERLTGWTEREARGEMLWKVCEREGRPVEWIQENPVDILFTKRAAPTARRRVIAITRQGERIPVDVQAEAILDAEGRLAGMALVFHDVSRLVAAEADSIRLAAIVESSNDAIISQTLDGRITSWNRAAEAMFGYRTAEAIGRPVQELIIPPERQDEELKILADLVHGEERPAYDTLRRTRSGELLNVSVSISPIRDASGRIVGASKIARDVSRQRRAEAALRESEARMRFTLEWAQIGDWSLDLASGRIQRSLRHDRCFGYAALQPEWNLEVFFRHVHPADRADVEDAIDLAMRRMQDWRVQCRVIWPDASVHWLSLHGSVPSSGGNTGRVVGIVTEITRQRQAEEARLKAERLEAENRQIQEASRLKSQFLANMSHELRTPLNAVIGFSDLLHSGMVPPESPQHRDFLGHIGTSGRHLLQLINDVLDLSKVESGKFDFFPETVDLVGVINEAKEILQTATQRKGIAVIAEIDPSLGDLFLDPARLRQVLYNYLSNAIKFSAVDSRVTVRAQARGPDRFRLEVEDHGVGIAAEDLPRLFTEFQQLDSGYSKQHQGTGLGLALTRRLVEAQGGTVGVHSRLGEGSVFWVELNRRHGFDAARALGANAEASAARAEPGPAGPAGSEAPRVLVIEDDEADRARWVQAFIDAGFEVDAAADGRYALRKALGTAYSALTLDLRMKDQPGLELLASIREQGASRDSPVVALSMPAESGPSAAFSIADVLHKPIRSDEVLSAMAGIQAALARPIVVMVIDDEALALDLMHSTLATIGIDTVGFGDGRAALAELDRLRPDAIVLDLLMPGFDGFQVLDEIRRRPPWQAVPVFIWTSLLLTEAEYRRLARSASAIVLKGGGAIDDVLRDVRGKRPAMPPADSVRGDLG